MFSSKDHVLELNSSNCDTVNKKIFHPFLKGKKCLVFFGAPWCGYCVQASTPYKKAADVLGSSFPLCYINCEKYPKIGEAFGVKGYPTIMFVNNTGKPYKKYDGLRTMDGFLNGACKEAFICSKRS